MSEGRRGMPRVRHSVWLGAAVAAILSLFWSCKSSDSAGVVPKRASASITKEAPPVAWNIELTGSGLAGPTVVTYEQLCAMEMTQLKDVLQQKTHFPDDISSWRGVPLDELLRMAGIKPGPMTFTLEAVDGYRITGTSEDLASAIIALQDGEGRWLSEIGRRRPVKLVPPHATGDYWVRNLTRIIVEPVAESSRS